MVHIPSGFIAQSAASVMKLFQASTATAGQKTNDLSSGAADKSNPMTIGGRPTITAASLGERISSFTTISEKLSPDLKPGSAEFKAAERRRIESHYAALNQDVDQNFEAYAAAAVGISDGTKNNAELQEALQNGTATIESGDGYGMAATDNKFFYDQDGSFRGMAAANWDGSYDQSKLKDNGDGTLTVVATGKRAIIGAVTGKTFVISY
jgi:hypothetical protein